MRRASRFYALLRFHADPDRQACPTPPPLSLFFFLLLFFRFLFMSGANVIGDSGHFRCVARINIVPLLFD